MNKPIFILLAITLITCPAIAEENGSDYLNPNPELSKREEKGIELSKTWIDNKNYPNLAENGKLVYLYGTTLPVVVCSVMYPSDIELQEGEIIKGVDVGDTLRWKVSISKSGPASNEVPHIIVKPTDVGLETALIINTDRRTYYIKLISKEGDFNPRLGFHYPEILKEKWQSYVDAEAKKVDARTISKTGENIDELFFDYKVRGKAPWKPLRVYHNGLKTIIQMPKNIQEMPVLLVLGKDNQEELVNYRVHEDRYVVDRVFEKAMLVAGVGNDREKITITKESN